MTIPTIPSWLIWAIWLLPLAAFAVLLLYRLLPGRPKASYLIIGATLVALGLSLWTLASVSQAPGHVITVDSLRWLSIGSFQVDFGLLVDGLSAIMLVVVTTVSLMVQIYSRGYMHTDPGYQRYYAFLALFTFTMLGLVLANNLLLTFMSWELVGLCSYLLIGFWFHRPAAAAAAKKAFLVTRIGDVGFLAAILVLYANAHTLDIPQLHGLVAAGAIAVGALTWAAVGLFLGAMGKSAQFPLHVWLPDAMEGPTPVSALIHAATMVAAGVFLVARMYPIFQAVPGMLTLVASVGGFTAVFAATMGIVMHDVKRVLAYSTISQLGLMMMGLALGGVGVGMFHLFNHAFFKALLFLGAGSLSHAVGTFDMREMGGLRKKLPFTYATFLIGTLALAGIWPLSGFFSKEEIMESALSSQPIFFVLGLLSVFLTAFYMFRVLFLVFGGDYRGNEHPHEASRNMLFPMLLLAVLAISSGWINAGGGFHILLGGSSTEIREPLDALLRILTEPLTWISLGTAGLGILLAFAIYSRGWLSARKLGERFGLIYTALIHKYWLDDLWEHLLARDILYRGIFQGLAFFDRSLVDNVSAGLGRLSLGASRLMRRTENGQLQFYGIFIALGAAVLILAVVLTK
jgi:NADH-quinone oxidoreductase subunit L